ncbi:hypothetical protein HDU96_000511 [Phlyctochytrium bullatum]|nr:hypothetical protein HDU96_000511 [Phlyctochytrium bullatum]
MRVIALLSVGAAVFTLSTPTHAQSSTTSATWWKPTMGMSFAYKLSGNDYNYNLNVSIMDGDIDNGFLPSKAHAAGKKAACYVNVGSLETEPGARPDQSSFPSSVLGAEYPGWDERYLDIRSAEVRNAMRARFQKAKDAGCDAIEPDNMESYAGGNATGFPLTPQDGIDYNRWLIDQVHALGMAISLKNGAELLAAHGDEIISKIDFAVVEACFAQGVCDKYAGIARAGKPVFAVEYNDAGKDDGCNPISQSNTSTACVTHNGLGFDGFVTDCDLTGKATYYCQTYNVYGLRGPAATLLPTTTTTPKSSAASLGGEWESGYFAGMALLGLLSAVVGIF